MMWLEIVDDVAYIEKESLWVNNEVRYLRT